jgi:5'-deoxynucleotidase YfbR-like HD superfamily hydrolase
LKEYNLKETLNFIIRGAEVTRYHTVKTLVDETVGHHSHMVAMLCWVVYPNCSRDLLVAALAHDLAEHVVGDCPAPAKRELGIGESVNALEERLLKSAGLDVRLDDYEKHLLKFADNLQGLIKCGREIEMGNKRLQSVFDRYRSYLEANVMIGREKELFNLVLEYFNESK